MIVSHSLRFIFIKNAKVAGTSMEAYLAQFCGRGDLLTRPNWHGVDGKNQATDAFSPHAFASRLRQHLGAKIWSGYFKFCFERDPLDKAVSSLFFERRRRGVELTASDWARMHAPSYVRNFPRYTDRGEPIVDFIGKFEDLRSDFAHVCKEIDVPFEGDLGKREKGNIRPTVSDPETLFTPYERKCIRASHHEESRLLGYPVLPAWERRLIRHTDYRAYLKAWTVLRGRPILSRARDSRPPAERG